MVSASPRSGGHDSVSARIPRAGLTNRLRGPGDDEEATVYNRRDYLQSGGPELTSLAEEIMARAEAECLNGTPMAGT